jgi:hypothetical protein
VGEQSNAYRILLRYDRKSRHRRIKKQRRYERLAATSQLSLWSNVEHGHKLVPVISNPRNSRVSSHDLWTLCELLISTRADCQHMDDMA